MIECPYCNSPENVDEDRHPDGRPVHCGACGCPLRPPDDDWFNEQLAKATRRASLPVETVRIIIAEVGRLRDQRSGLLEGLAVANKRLDDSNTRARELRGLLESERRLTRDLRAKVVEACDELDALADTDSRVFYAAVCATHGVHVVVDEVIRGTRYPCPDCGQPAPYHRMDTLDDVKAWVQGVLNGVRLLGMGRHLPEPE